jgi:hypothetical protein
MKTRQQTQNDRAAQIIATTTDPVVLNAAITAYIRTLGK